PTGNSSRKSSYKYYTRGLYFKQTSLIVSFETKISLNCMFTTRVFGRGELGKLLNLYSGGAKSYMSNGNYNKPFNDAIAHKQNIEGYAKNTAGKVPLPTKILLYFMFGSAFIMIILSIISYFL
uniref:hypothetical protein n=1 Tax=Thalassobacillus sp. CUG 92003 TaxID=2736641 RepID=UPI001C62993E